MARYLNPMPAPASQGNVAITTAAAITITPQAQTSDVELTCTVDAVVSFGIVGQASPPAANISAGATGQHLLPAFQTRGFSIAGNAKFSVIALSANGALWVSEMT